MSLSVTGGLYSAVLGTTPGDPLPPTLFDGTVRYLELSVDGDLLSPRQPLGSVPYALLSAGVQGGPVNATILQVGGTTVVNDAGHQVISVKAPARSSMTLQGLYCGGSSSTQGRVTDPSSGITGYRGAKLICESVCGSPTAHLCSCSELTQGLQLGLAAPPQSWCSSSTLSLSNSNAPGTPATYMSDCSGWTNAIDWTRPGGGSATILAPVWGPGMAQNSCANFNPLACCD